MNNEKLESIANKVISRINPPHSGEDSGSIIVVLTVISIILTLVRVIQECDKDKTKFFSSAAQASHMKDHINNICIKKTWINQWRLNRIIKKELNKTDYKLIGDKLKNAIMDVGSQLTDDESLTLMEAANV